MAPQASRRFHEAGVGSRTGLRLSAVARDQDGFEDLEAFYKASQAALDDRQHPPENDDEDDDYDSFDETHFTKRPATNGRRSQAAGSSSMTMDLQNSSAPSRRSILRSARPSTSRQNITLADDDDDLDLPDVSTGSRSFDLGAMGGDADIHPDLRAPPAKGLSARQAGSSAPAKATGKGKAAPKAKRIELSDSEDDVVLKRSNNHYTDVGFEDEEMDVVDDDDITPVLPAKPKAPAEKQKAIAKPAAKPATKKRPAPTEPEMHIPASQSSKSQPTASTSSPKRKAPKPQKSRSQVPDFEPIIDLDEPDYLPYHSPSPPPPPPPPAKRQRPTKPPVASEEPSARPRKPLAPTNGKAAKSKPSKPPSKRKAGETVEKVRPPPPQASVFDENGIRRSTRQRFAPLEYWRGERIRYGRPSLPTDQREVEFEDDPSLMLSSNQRRRVPVLDIKEVIRVPRAPGEGTFSGTTRRKPSAPSRKSEDRKRASQTPTPAPLPEDLDQKFDFHLDPTLDTVHVEDGWDARTVENGIVVDEDGLEYETSIVRTKSTLKPVAVMGQEFMFEKLFNCGGLMATGVLHLPPGTRKPTKPSKDNTFVFCVLQGALRATVHRKSFIVGPEGVFQVPAGNTYALENVCERDVKLFFAQCRKVLDGRVGDLSTWTMVSDTSYGTPGRRIMGRGAEEEQEEEGEGESEGERGPLVVKQGKGRGYQAEESSAEDESDGDFERSQQLKKAKAKGKKKIFKKI